MKNVLLFLAVLMLCQSCGFEVVDDGYVGIKKSMGKIEKEIYKPGVHVFMPMVTRIFEMEVREQTWSGKVSGFSADNQIIDAEFKVNYRPDASKMAELYVAQGDDYIQKIVPQRVTTPLKEVIGKYRATDLVAARNKINSESIVIIRKRLEGTNVNLVSFEITNFNFDDDFEAAVKAKVVAKERAIEEKNRTVQIKEQAAQKVLSAKAEATKIKVMAAALAKNKDLIQLEAVKKWNGILPTYMMGSSATPFIKIP